MKAVAETVGLLGIQTEVCFGIWSWTRPVDCTDDCSGIDVRSAVGGLGSTVFVLGGHVLDYVPSPSVFE
jgi:hypothetical protein